MPNPVSRVKRRKIVRGESRAMIAKVYHFLQEEYNFMKATNTDFCDLSPLAGVRKRTAEATGVSESTVTKVLREEQRLPSPSTKFVCPLKKRRKRSCKFNFDGLNSDVVRTTIQNYHIEHKKFPSLAKLKAALKEKLDFDGCILTLRNKVRNMGYFWKKHGNHRKIMQERHDLQLRRYQFLKKILQYRSEDRQIVYAGETEVSIKKKAGPHIHYIVVHAGTKYGFIPNASSVFEASPITTKNQPKMTPDAYILWLQDHLLPNLPKKSVVVIANEPYHNMLSFKIPTHFSSKDDIRMWLLENGIKVDVDLHKIELYEILKTNKEKFKRYKIDELIQSQGFEVVRLPPYHPELNAIENVWSVLKSQIDCVAYYPKINVEHIIHESLNKIDSLTWGNACSHVERLEEEYKKYSDLDVELLAKIDDWESDSDTDYIEEADGSSLDELSD